MTSHDETAATAWLREQLHDELPIGEVRRLALRTWSSLTAGNPFAAPQSDQTSESDTALGGRVIECALLDRKTKARVRYRALEATEVS